MSLVPISSRLRRLLGLDSDDVRERDGWDDNGPPLACDTCEWLRGEMEQANKLLHQTEVECIHLLGRGEQDRNLRVKVEKLKRDRDGIVQCQLSHQKQSHRMIP